MPGAVPAGEAPGAAPAGEAPGAAPAGAIPIAGLGPAAAIGATPGWGYPGWGYGGWGYGGGWGWGAAGLATGLALGAAVANPYPVYPAAAGGIGGTCWTPVRVCALIGPAEIGSGCSCRVSGGRARGAVTP